MRLIIIGDIHGCSGALNTMLEKVKPGNADQLVLLGDLFDRGSKSWEVFQTVKMIADTMDSRFVLLRGNHEDYLLQPKLSFSQRLVWERVGRGATVRSFKEHGGRMEDAIPWLQEHCRMYWQGDGIQCVHAGLKVEPIEINDTQTLIHDHSVALENRYAGPLTVVGHIALSQPTYFAGDGETVQKLNSGEWQPLPEKGVICIDTGCGKGGCLTAMIVEDGQYRLVSAWDS